MPGRKVLVLGNHDVSIDRLVVADGFTEVHSTLCPRGSASPDDASAASRTVRKGCVNVRDHLHGARVRGRTLHINVLVKQVHYRPRLLTASACSPSRTSWTTIPTMDQDPVTARTILTTLDHGEQTPERPQNTTSIMLGISTGGDCRDHDVDPTASGQTSRIWKRYNRSPPTATLK